MKQFEVEKYFQQFSSTLFDGVIITDLEGTIFSVNSSAMDLFPKLLEQDLIGTSIQSVVLSKVLRQFYENYQSMRNIPLTVGANHILMNIREISNEFCIIVLKNITKLNHLAIEKKDLQENIRVIHRILDVMDVGICFINSKQEIVFYNKKMGEFDAIEPSSVLGEVILKELLNSLITKESIVHSLINEEELMQSEAFYSRNGKRYLINQFCMPVFSGNKKVGALAIVKDYSDIEKIIKENFMLKNYPPPKEQDKSDNTTHEAPILIQSKSMKKIMQDVEKVQSSHANLLLYGARGVGKSTFIHRILQKMKKDRHVCLLDCEAIPDILIEQQLFGKEEEHGFFHHDTNAVIVFENITSMGITLQHKIYKECVTKLNAAQHLQILATMVETPSQAFEKRLFVEDLFYLISGVCINVPSLQERKDDTLLLLNELIKLHPKNFQGIKQNAMDVLLSYDWPGNIRQVQIVIEGIAALCVEGEVITEAKLPNYIRQHSSEKKAFSISGFSLDSTSGLSLTEQLERFEEDVLRKTLRSMNYHITNAAEQLGLTRQSLNYKIKKYAIEISRGGKVDEE